MLEVTASTHCTLLSWALYIVYSPWQCNSDDHDSWVRRQSQQVKDYHNAKNNWYEREPHDVSRAHYIILLEDCQNFKRSDFLLHKLMLFSYWMLIFACIVQQWRHAPVQVIVVVWRNRGDVLVRLIQRQSDRQTHTHTHTHGRCCASTCTRACRRDNSINHRRTTPRFAIIAVTKCWNATQTENPLLLVDDVLGASRHDDCMTPRHSTTTIPTPVVYHRCVKSDEFWQLNFCVV